MLGLERRGYCRVQRRSAEPLGPPLPTATPTSEPVDDESPPAPNTLSPKNGETVGCAASIPLQWSAVDDPSGIAAYTIQVEQGLTWVPAPGSPFTTTNTALDFEVNCGAFYRWRVRAEDGAGIIGGGPPIRLKTRQSQIKTDK